MPIISHASVGVTDVAQAIKMYGPMMQVLGAKEHKRVKHAGNVVAVGYGVYYPEFWIGLPEDKQNATAGNGVHISFSCSSQKQVDQWHAAALANGATCAGKPGPRPQYSDKFPYYAAFVVDADGNKLEATFVDLGWMAYCSIQ